MGYFEGLVNGNFKKDTNGNIVFFPWGILGRGRVLPDEATETRARAFVGRYYKISLPMIIGVGVIVGWAWLLLLVPVLVAWFYFGTKSLVSGCPYSEDRFTLRQRFATLAKSYDKLTLWLLFIFSILFVFLGLYVLGSGKTSGEMMLGWSSVVFFGVGGLAFGYMLKVKRSENG